MCYKIKGMQIYKVVLLYNQWMMNSKENYTNVLQMSNIRLVFVINILTIKTLTHKKKFF